MKTFHDYLEFVSGMRTTLNSEETTRLVRKVRSESWMIGYVASMELPIYPTHDNQLLFSGMNLDDVVGLMDRLGFKVIDERISENSRWDWYVKGSFKQYSMRFGEMGISAVVGYDPANINFALLDKEMLETAIGLKVESLEVEFLGKESHLVNSPQFMGSMPLSTFVTLHPGDAISQQCEDVVIGLLEHTMHQNSNAFYGGFKSQRGVLHQVDKNN